MRSTGNTVWWGGGDARVEPFAQDARGWQVTSAALAAVLLEAASDAGVQIEHELLGADGLAGPGAQVVLDCTGRAGRHRARARLAPIRAGAEDGRARRSLASRRVAGS